MYLAGSPDAWDLLWAIPNEPIINPPTSPLRTVIVRRVAPFLTANASEYLSAHKSYSQDRKDCAPQLAVFECASLAEADGIDIVDTDAQIGEDAAALNRDLHQSTCASAPAAFEPTVDVVGCRNTRTQSQAFSTDLMVPASSASSLPFRSSIPSSPEHTACVQKGNPAIFTCHYGNSDNDSGPTAFRLQPSAPWPLSAYGDGNPPPRMSNYWASSECAKSKSIGKATYGNLNPESDGGHHDSGFTKAAAPHTATVAIQLPAGSGSMNSQAVAVSAEGSPAASGTTPTASEGSAGSDQIRIADVTSLIRRCGCCYRYHGTGCCRGDSCDGGGGDEQAPEQGKNRDRVPEQGREDREHIMDQDQVQSVGQCKEAWLAGMEAGPVADGLEKSAEVEHHAPPLAAAGESRAGPAAAAASQHTSGPLIGTDAAVAAAAAPSWSLETLQRLCRNRDPRLCRMPPAAQQQLGGTGLEEIGQLQQQQQQRGDDSPAGTSMRVGLSGNVEEPQPLQPTMATTMELPVANPSVAAWPPGWPATTGNVVDSARGQLSPPPPMLPLPLPRRGPKTTTARLLLRMRSKTVAPSVKTNGAVGRSGDGGGLQADAVGGATTAERGCKRRGSSSDNVAIVQRAAAATARTMNDREIPGRNSAMADKRYDSSENLSSSDDESDDDLDWECVKRRRPATGKPVGRCRTSMSLLEEMKRALEAAASTVGDVDGADAAAAPLPLRTAARRLAPLCKRFDFRTVRRRGLSAAGAAATVDRRVRGAVKGEARLWQSGEAAWQRRTRTATKTVFEDNDCSDAVGAAVTGGGGGYFGSNGTVAADVSAQAQAFGGGSGGTALTLLQALDEWRTRRARSVRQTPEAMLRPGLLAAVAARCPTSVLELEEVPGLPRPFVRRYGQEILDICRNHAHLRAAKAAEVEAAIQAQARHAAAEAADSDGEECAAAATDGCGNGNGEGGDAAANTGAGGRRVCKLSSSQHSTEENGMKTNASSSASRALHVRQHLLGLLGVMHHHEGVNCVREEVEAAQQHKQQRRASAPARLPSAAFVVSSVHVKDGTGGRSKGEGESADLGFLRTGDPAVACVHDGGGDGAAVCGSQFGDGCTRFLTKAQTAARRCGGQHVVDGHDAASPGGPLRQPKIAPAEPTGASAQPAYDGDIDASDADAFGAATAAEMDAARAAGGLGVPAAAAVTSAASATRAEGNRITPPFLSVHVTVGEKRATGRRPSPGKQIRKRYHGDSPRAAVAAAATVAVGAKAAATAGPTGWVPLPDGCRARGGSNLAFADTPILNGARVKCLLGILAEAGTAAAPYLGIQEAAAAASVKPPPLPLAAAARGARARAAAADAVASAAAVLPSTAVALAAGAQCLGRTAAGQEQVRRLRAMVELAMPAWEVRRVLACMALGPAAQAAAVLRLDPGASRDAVRLAFRRLSLLVHPDKNRSPGATEAFGLVSAAASKLLGSWQ